MQLLSQPNNNQTEKQAFTHLAKGMGSLASRKDFIGGLLAPLVKTYGGLQRAVGYGKQLPAVMKNPNATKGVLKKDKLFAQGSKDIQAGGALRQQSELNKIFDSKTPLGYRAGRGLGAAAIGAPIALAPFTIPQYLGAASADPALAKEYAKNTAYDRVQERLNQFSEMPFLERIQTAWKPEKFTQNLQAPEAASVYESLSDNNINNPGILKYLSSFNPFLSNPDDVISQKVRSEILRNMQNGKEASDLTKQATALQNLFYKVLKPAYNYGKSTRGIAVGGKVPKKIKPYNPHRGKSYVQGLMGDAAVLAGKHPVLSSLGALGVGLTPYSMYNSYQAGKDRVYNEAANTATGMADLGFMEKFNQPGFMGGLGRAGMAIAPGMGSDMILKQIRQSMFPEVNQQQR
jgi:hypothetical protein